MSDTASGQVSAGAAEIYEAHVLPALIQEWAPRVADAARVARGQRVLDVACGTGVLTRTLAERVGPEGAAVGLDLNRGMLAVARRKAPALTWVEGRAEALPFDDGAFDAVTCQFGLMFFEDQLAALREMVRVLRPGGRLALAVWDALERSPGYAAMAALLERLFGDEVARSLHVPYALGDPAALRALFADAGLTDVEVTTHEGRARFPSVRSWVFTEVRGWTAAALIDEAGFERLATEAEHAFRSFVAADGTVSFSTPAHVAAVRPLAAAA